MGALPTTRRRAIVNEIQRGVTKGTSLRKTTQVETKFGPDVMDHPSEHPKGMQVTTSEGHPFHTRSKGNRTDLGGNFSTTKSWIEPIKSSSMTVTQDVSGFIRKTSYRGPILPLRPLANMFPPSVASSSLQLDKLGATAISRCKPTNSVADASTFLGELYKEGLPHLVGSSLWEKKNNEALAKRASGEFLNVEFGWLPMVRDVRSFANAAYQANAVLKQYERDAGKVVRRRYNFPDQVEISDEIGGGSTTVAFYGPSNSNFQTPDTPIGSFHKRTEVRHKRWFSGAFTYALPSGYDSRSELDRYALLADKVLGITPSPETLWNLAPWSWAVDWFSNTGDVISNIEAWKADGLVMLWGYMMETSTIKYIYTKPKTGLNYNNSPAHPLIFVTETKTRRGANPFGFGISWDGLSPIQRAIAAAIGITRLT